MERGAPARPDQPPVGRLRLAGRSAGDRGATLLLAGVALWRRTPRSRLLALLALVTTLLALGERTPAYGLLVKLPPFLDFRGPFKFHVVSNFTVIWLAAQGLGRCSPGPAVRSVCSR